MIQSYQYREKVRVLKSIRGSKCEACPKEKPLKKLYAHHINAIMGGKLYG